MKKKQVHKGLTIHEYEVVLPPNEKATDQEILDYCDKGNFGGIVLYYPAEFKYKVWVYTD